MIQDDEDFRRRLRFAQQGNIHCQRHVVQASLPILWRLAESADEVQELVIFLYNVALPKWTPDRSWVGHCTALLSWRIRSHRRDERRRDDRFNPKVQRNKLRGLG